MGFFLPEAVVQMKAELFTRRYGLERLGKPRKEFARGEGPRGLNERARVSPISPGLARRAEIGLVALKFT
jgi:hypothetical protein